MPFDPNIPYATVNTLNLFEIICFARLHDASEIPETNAGTKLEAPFPIIAG